MAGIGSAWGSREEMLHPRDRHGRFRKKWKMAASVVDALSSFLDRFQPHTFQSDQQASQYSFNRRKAPWTDPELQRLHTDWDDANESLQAGEMDDTTKKFVAMMDRNMVETTDDLIVSQTVPTEAFGLSPQQAQLEEGGLEDLIGLEIGDAGYSAANLGSELSHPPGSVTLRVAVPKGTRVAYGGRSPSDRALIFDRDQPLVVTKVESDGRGGWYMLAIAGSGRKTQGAEAVAQDRTHGRRGSGLTPEQREARVTPQMSGEERLRIAQQNEREMQTGPSAVTPAPGATQTPAPAAPASSAAPAPPATGVTERREPVHSSAVGPGSPEGKSASDIATDAEVAKVEAANAPPAPAAPATPESFRQALMDADLKAPSRGSRQKEFDAARVGIVSGKQNPQDALRQLETDIEVNKRKLERVESGQDKPDPELAQDIKDQEALADLISSHHGTPRRGREAKGTGDGTSPTPTPAKAQGPTPTPGAPSTKKEATPKAPEAGPDRRTKAQLLEEAGDAGRARMTKEQLRQAIEHKKARDATPAPVPEAKAPGSKFTPAQEDALVERAKKFRGNEKNSEQERIVGEADAILARRGDGAPTKTAPKKAVPEAPAAPAKAVAKKAAPAKAAPSPVDAEEEAFKARVAEAGLPDRVTALRAMAKDQKIRGFSTMNKRQLQSALLGDEVPKAGKIGVVSPAKIVPHLEAVESDQAARKLLESHTLPDLKALAKERGVEVPKRGATKDKLKDDILADIRGVPEGAGGETPARSLRQELSAQKWVEPADPTAADKVRGIIDGTDEMDAAELRGSRDDLEKYSKELRAGGNRQDANLVQTLADTMGMRAQTISGVEEGAPPVKRVAKKAVPEVADVPEAPKTLDKMLKPELEHLARMEGVPGVRKSMTKAQLKDAIEKNRRMDSSRGGETDEERIRRELGQLPGGPERDLGPAQGPLRLPDRAPSAEEIARDAVPEAAPPVKKVTKKAAKKAVADVDKAADTVSGQLKETFGDTLRQTDAEGLRQAVKESGLGDIEGNTAEEIFDNTIKKMLESRMRELGMLPDDPKKPTKAQKRVPKGSVTGPKADVPIQTEDRRGAFTEAWDKQGFGDDPSLGEIRDDIASGKLSHEEGVRRIESEISFNEEEISDLGAELRGMSPEDRDPEGGTADSIHARRAELSDKITAQKKAVTFLRGHAKDEAPVTRQELEVKLDGPEKAALDRVDVDSLKEAARNEGLGDIEGDDKDTVIQNIAKAVAGRELRDRAAKKAVPTAAPEAPASPAPAKKAAKFLPPLKDGTQRKSFTNVEVGDVVQRAGARQGPAKRVTKVERGPGGVDLTFEDGTTVNGNPNTAAWMGRDAPSAPEAPAPAKATKAVPAPGKVTRAPGAPPGWKARKTGDGSFEIEDSGGKVLGTLRQEDFEDISPGDNGIGRITRRKQFQFQPADGGPERPVRTARLGDAMSDLAFERQRARTSSAPTPAPKAAVPAKATPPPVVDLDNPTRHDAELIGTGLDIDAKGEDRQWMDVVQSSLDRGESGPQIADGLRREADSQRTLHNITESVGGTEGASPAARINRMELMADRLEGVKPIKKAAPPAKVTSGPEKRELGTMQAAQAQSKALFDLRNGKSHAEVATALRQAATGVGSREHDPQTVRPLEFTPSERSAMKRNDAKKLRELAAEIQAEGVAQRAAAKAAKKAAPAKAPVKKATVNPNLSDLSDDELRKIIASDQFPQSQKDAVQGELDARAAKKVVPAKAAAPKQRTAAEMRRAQALAGPD